MVRHHFPVCTNSFKLAFLVVFVVFLKLFSFRTETFYECLPMTNLSEQEFLETPFDPLQNLDIDENAEAGGEITNEMRKVFNILRQQIQKETKGYQLPSSRFLQDLFPEKGGTPMRSIVITTWRSGSTFIGAVLNSHPGTFHYSEPLTEYKTVQIRSEPLASPAVRTLRSLLTCNYHTLEGYLKRSREYPWLFTHNTRLWGHCMLHKNFCWKPEFLSNVCRLFPFQSMKVVHIRLRLVEQLLAESRLNVRVVLLVRDPRGVLESRANLNWCQLHQDCSSPDSVCSDMVDDYSAALRFTKLFPTKFKVVRYEDMSLSPHTVIPDLFKFFGLQYHPDVQEFVKVHTSQEKKNAYGTSRNSTVTALHWRQKSSYPRVKELQKVCRVAMSAWGYLPAHNASHLLEFNPLVEPFMLP